MADSLQINPEEPKEDQQHIDDMVKKAEGDQPVEEPQEEKMFAGKYKTEEELQKGTLELLKKEQGFDNLEDFYKSLESKQGKQEPEEPKVEDKEPTKEDIEDIDITTYEQEFAQSGELSEESYKDLKDKGFSKNMIDRYIEGTQAIADRQAQEVFSVVGGEEQYSEMLEWADTNLSEEDKVTFNESIMTNNVSKAKFAVEGLYSRYSKDAGSKPSRVLGGKTSTGTSTARFNSRAEVTEAMSNPKYETDSAFRAEVQKKLMNSDVF